MSGLPWYKRRAWKVAGVTALGVVFTAWLFVVIQFFHYDLQRGVTQSPAQLAELPAFAGSIPWQGQVHYACFRGFQGRRYWLVGQCPPNGVIEAAHTWGVRLSIRPVVDAAMVHPSLIDDWHLDPEVFELRGQGPVWDAVGRVTGTGQSVFLQYTPGTQRLSLRVTDDRD